MKKLDLIIIGGGAAAFAAAIKANELGAKTAMIQGPLPLGGTCVNIGCVPSKVLVHAAGVAHRARQNSVKGIDVELKGVNFAEVIRAELKLVAELRKEKYEDVLASLDNVQLIEGMAVFVNDREVEVGQERLRAEKFLISTGTTAIPPNINGLEEAGYLTHINALSNEQLPKSLAVVGGGAVALEFAQIFSRFGSKVTIIVRGKDMYSGTEPELIDVLEGVFSDEGITVLKESTVSSVKKDGNHKVIRMASGGEEQEIVVDELLMATGKTPNTKSLALELAGVKVDERGSIVASPILQTSASHIFTAGDVTNLPKRLETTAGREGSFAAENALSNTKKTIDYQTVPWTVFTDPELSGVGILDSDTSKHGISCTCNTVDFKMIPKARILGDTRGRIKMVMDRDSREIVGIHILAKDSGNLIGQAELVLKNKMTVDDVLNTLPVFPTLSESIKTGALSLTTDISKLSCCV